MRVEQAVFNNEIAISIYITEEERRDENIKNKIEQYSKKFKHVATFVSGAVDVKKVIREVIKS